MRIIPSLLLIGVSVGALAGCSVAPPDTRAALELTGAGQAAGLPMSRRLGMIRITPLGNAT